MNTILLQKTAAALSRGLPCVVLLVLVGCGQTPDSPADSTGTQRSETSQPATEDEATSQPESVPPKPPVAEKTAEKKESATPPSPATTPVDVPRFMEDALEGDTTAVEQAIDAGVDVNAIDEEKRTALMLAGFNGHTATVKRLLEHGAKLDNRDSMGRTALMFAATGDNADTCKALLDAGADVNATDTGEGFTALMHAAAEGQLEVVNLLLEHKADRSRRDIDGDTAKSFAEQNGHAEVVKALAK